MDPETVFISCTTLAIDVCFFGLFYKLYKNKSECLKSLKAAECFEINSELKDNIQMNGGVVPYAVVSGKVKALSAPLQSQYLSHLRGVIREKITKKHTVRWIPLLRIWSSANHHIQHKLSSIPFALYGRSNGLFKKQVFVEVIDPLAAEELVIPGIYDEFITHQDTLGEAMFNFFKGEHTIGIQEIENMLSEDASLTAVGKLIIENDKLQIKPPDLGLTYFLTPLTLESLIKKISDATKVYKVVTIFTGTLSLFLFMYIAGRAFSELKRRLKRSRELERCEKARRQRLMADTSRKLSSSDNFPKCVICLENPVEILILECGHACLCLNCSELMQHLCPVCRSKIDRLVPAFLP